MQISLDFMLYCKYIRNGDFNLNNTYYETLDKNFKEALNLIEKPLTHEQLIELLKIGNIPQKHLAALRLDEIRNLEETKILLNNLTGQDGKIREAVSLRIRDFMKDRTILELFGQLDCSEEFLDAVTDINGNICRNIIEAICYLKQNKEFCRLFCTKLINKTSCLAESIKKFDFKDGKYKVNKEVFKLYWCLEAIYYFADKISIKELKNILLQTKNIEEYTIREKTAKILSIGFEDKTLKRAQEELKQDKNYYVRRY